MAIDRQGGLFRLLRMVNQDVIDLYDRVRNKGADPRHLTACSAA